MSATRRRKKGQSTNYNYDYYQVKPKHEKKRAKVHVFLNQQNLLHVLQERIRMGGLREEHVTT